MPIANLLQRAVGKRESGGDLTRHSWSGGTPDEWDDALNMIVE